MLRAASPGDLVELFDLFALISPGDLGELFDLFGRLMERTGVESRKTKMTTHWGIPRNDVMDIGQSEYITRLTALRDSLINQEQVYLAQALDRLRIHSLTNRSSTYRLRMLGEDIDGKVPQPAPRKNMLTTVEKFRQMRIKPHHPSIFPIQGTQLFDQGSPRKITGKEPGGATSRSEKDGPASDRSLRSCQAKLEESIQANLQRLLQPRSSIPNIGRKAIKQHENLEVKPKPIGNIRSRVYKSSGKQLTSPTQASKLHMSTQGALSPDHYQLQVPHDPGYLILKDDTLDIDTIQDLSYDYYLVPPSSREAEGANEMGLDEREPSGKYPNSKDMNNSKIVNRSRNITVNGLDRTNRLDELAVSPKNVISVFLPNNSYDDIAGNSIYSSDDDDAIDVADKRGSAALKATNSSPAFNELSGSRNKATSRHNRDGHDLGSSRLSGAQNGRQATHFKKQAEVAPAIILNPATPDYGLTPQTRPGFSGQKTALEKTLKQKELRQRELQHLFDDVTELNTRADHMTTPRSMHTLT
ncbi:hypothetical protein Btru_006500 [Bulinus truncatus]|nr:hypothetical protein Btru_006500 [Bulinus truncatus]